MIFFNKYKIDLDISRYDALKLLLDNFHQLGSDSDLDKLFYGTCENGVFHFKSKAAYRSNIYLCSVLHAFNR